MTAVSARNICGPRETTGIPASTNNSSSFSDHPPSGPMKTVSGFSLSKVLGPKSFASNFLHILS